MQGLGFRARGSLLIRLNYYSGFMVYGLGFIVYCLGLRVRDRTLFRVEGSGSYEQ